MMMAVEKKMYIQAEIEIISEIDESISLNDWEKLVESMEK